MLAFNMSDVGSIYSPGGPLATKGFSKLFFDSVPPVVPERFETTPSLTADEEFCAKVCY